MFQVDHYIKSAGTAPRRLSALAQCTDIMEAIRTEDPSYWPYGLDASGFDDLYMVRSASTSEPVGFVGWQKRYVAPHNVGYYAIGILPEYRHNGMAKEAVTKMLAVKSAEVDQVRAFIMPHNAPSMALAESLHIPVVKDASIKSAGPVGEMEAGALSKVLPGLLKLIRNHSVQGAVGNSLVWDGLANHNHYGDWNAGRALNFGLNGTIGALGGHSIGQGKKLEGISTMLMSPVKDVLVGLIPSVNKLPGTIDKIDRAFDNPQQPPAAPSTGGRNLAMALGALGIGGLGYMGAKSIAHALRQNSSDATGGRISVKLPSKGRETTVDMPLDNFNLSPTLLGSVHRDTRRSLREGARERTWHRDDQGHLLTHGEAVGDQDLAQDMAGEASDDTLNMAKAAAVLVEALS